MSSKPSLKACDVLPSGSSARDACPFRPEDGVALMGPLARWSTDRYRQTRIGLRSF